MTQGEAAMKSMNRRQIEEQARRFQKEIWQYRDRIWCDRPLPAVHQMFTPEVACRVLGYEYSLVPDLGVFGDGTHRFKVAGTLDRRATLIQVSQRLTLQEQMFTGGHEIGHVILHPDQIVMHRDRPISGLGVNDWAKPLWEREADYFSACYRAPRKVVVDAFAQRFGSFDQFRFGDDEAFGLCPSNPRSLTGSSEDSLQWETTLAGAISYHGRFFTSLAEDFSLSLPTMAIRLREVGLERTFAT